MTDRISTSQKIFLREAQALRNMPRMAGKAACSGDGRFDILAEKDRVPREMRKNLAKTCARCPLRDCGWRQTSD